MQLALIGGEEFEDGFDAAHAALISPIAGGKSRGVFLPTCAAHDGLEVVKSWCRRAQQRLGPYSAKVDAPLVVDQASANDPAHAQLVAEADWVYLGGGFPHIGMGALDGTLVMHELRQAAARGALILGASAGAMMMCARSFVITPGFMSGATPPEPLTCLGFVPGSMCLPHFNRSYAQRWLSNDLRPSGVQLIGIDEYTALVHTDSKWEVVGNGTVSLFAKDAHLMRYVAGQSVPM